MSRNRDQIVYSDEELKKLKTLGRDLLSLPSEEFNSRFPEFYSLLKTSVSEGIAIRTVEENVKVRNAEELARVKQMRNY